MSRRTVTMSVPCPQCGASATEHVSASTDVARARLRVGIGFTCTGCGAVSEADAGEISDDQRAAFVASKGRWVLHVTELGPRRLDALAAIKTTVGITRGELMGFIRSNEPIATGARIEVELIQ